MTVFIVKWNDGCVALVAAENEVDLFDKLDEQGDPYVATWEPYAGDLWIEFGSLDESLPHGDVDIGDPAWRRVRVPGCVETAMFMVDALRTKTTPHVMKLEAEAYDQQQDKIPRAAFDSALQADRHIFLANSFEGDLNDYWGLPPVD